MSRICQIYVKNMLSSAIIDIVQKYVRYMSSTATDTSKKKISFRIMVSPDAHESFRYVCKEELDPSPSMSYEIERYLIWYVDCFNKTGKRPILPDICQEYVSDMSDIATKDMVKNEIEILKKEILETVGALENKNTTSAPTEKVAQPVEEMSGNDRFVAPEKTSNTSTDNISTNNHNQTTQSNSQNGQINSEQLSLTLAVETEKQENNLENPDSHLAASDAAGDNTSDAEKSVDEQVDTLMAKYPGLGLHQALARNRMGEYKKMPEEVKKAYCRKIKPTEATRLTQTEMGYRLDYSHGRNLGGLLKNGKFEYICKDKDPHKFIWEVDNESVTGDKSKYFKISNIEKELDTKDGGSDFPVKKKEVSLPEPVIPGKTKLRPDHLRFRLTQHWESLGNKPISRGGLQNNRKSVAAQNNPKHHQEWIRERDPDKIAWDYIEKDKKYLAIG